MKKSIYAVVLLAGAVILSSCATVLNTTTEDVTITTTPAMAKISIDGIKYGTSPQTINLDRKANHKVKIDLEGYDSYETQITRKISSWFWLNVFNGIVPGVLIDYISGAMYKLLPDAIEVTMQPAIPVKPTKK